MITLCRMHVPRKFGSFRYGSLAECRSTRLLHQSVDRYDYVMKERASIASVPYQNVKNVWKSSTLCG